MNADVSKAVFLSYASQDAEAAKRIAEALRAAGVEVWFDQNELVGGDQWDQKIRKQIKDCALLIPIISANTQSRTEGYFRLEWRLADQRTHLMAKGRPFLLPVVIDDTRDAEAQVPDSFTEVQWTRLRQDYGGQATDPATERFAARVKELLGGEGRDASPRRPSTDLPESSGRLGETSLPAKPSRPWLAPAITGVVALAALAIWQPWKKADRVSPSVPAVVTASSAELARLRARIIPDRWQKGDFEALAPALDRFLEKNPDDAEAWAMWSIINSLQVARLIDPGTKPLEVGKAAAERALRLSPDLPMGHLAQGLHQIANVSRGVDPRAARESIDRAVAQLPPDALTRYVNLISYWIGFDFENVERVARDWLAADSSATYPAWIMQQVFMHLRQPDVSEEWARRAIADPGITGLRARVNLVDLKFFLRADLKAAREMANQIPLGQRANPRAAFVLWLLAMAEQRWDEALNVLSSVPDDMFYDLSYNGPKALLVGITHQRAGRTAAAAIQFRDAERLLREHLATDSNNEILRAALALTITHLGRAGEARTELALVEPLIRTRAPSTYRGRLVHFLAQTHAALGEGKELAFWLRKFFTDKGGHFYTPNSLRLDFRYNDHLDSPEVQALLKEFAHLDSTAKADVAAPAVDDKSAPADKSVAVLAFANLSDDKGNEYFSDGISEELLNVLAKVPGLKVSARTSAFHFKGKDTPIPEIAKQLGVAYVVEGSVRKQGDKVRITAQLIKASDGFHVWSDTFTRDLKDIFAVQDEIAGLIAQQLQLKLGATKVTRVVNPEAYRLLLEGRQFWNLRTEEGFAKAVVAYTSALTLDPQFAEARAGLAGVYVIRPLYRELDGLAYDPEDLRRAVSEGRRALELDPASAEAHSALGYADHLADRLDDADRHFQRALTLNPNSVLGHAWYGLLLQAQGRLDVSIGHMQQAAELDPLWFINLQVLGTAHAFAQRYDDALAVIERAAALRTDIFWPNTAERARCLLAMGRTDEALAEARNVLRHPDVRPRWSSDAIAIRVLWEGGLQAEAEAEAARLLAGWSPDNYLRGFTLVALGRFGEAVTALEHTPSVMVRTIYFDRMFDQWRDDPRFAQLMAKFGRTGEYKVARETLARMLQEREAKK